MTGALPGIVLRGPEETKSYYFTVTVSNCAPLTT